MVKPLDDFPRDRSRPIGYHSACKPCRNAHRTATIRAKTGPAPIATMTSEQMVLTEARKQAVLKLVDRHRSEFDTLVHRARVAILTPDKGKND